MQPPRDAAAVVSSITDDPISLPVKRFYAQARKGGVCRVGVLVGAMLIAALSVYAEPAASQRIVCGLEVSGGSNVSADNVTLRSTLSSVDVLGVGVLGGLRADCGLQSKDAVVGAIFRAAVMTFSGDPVSHIVPGGAVTIKSDQLYEAALRAGIPLHKRYTLYGLAGWSWMSLDLPTPINTKVVNGPMLGGGLEAHVRGPWYIRTEYTWHHFAGQDVGACKIERDLHVARIGAVVKFDDLPNLPGVTR
jgi:opacity protein-like surface antigen